MERSWLCVKKKTLSTILPPYEAKLWITKPFNFFRAEKDADKASFLKRTKTAKASIREHSDSRSNPGAQGQSALSPVSSASSQTGLHCSVFSSPGCRLDTNFHIIIILSLHVHRFILNQTWNKTWFTNLLSFILDCKSLNLISGYHHTINYINLKIDFSTGFSHPLRFNMTKEHDSNYSPAHLTHSLLTFTPAIF